MSKDPDRTLRDAVQRGDLDGLRRLVAEGNDVNTMDRYGWNALFYASMRGFVDILHYCLQVGGDVNKATTPGGLRPLHCAAHEGNLECVKLLLESGATLEAGTADGTTAFHYACSLGHVDVVRYLIAQGADVTLTPDNAGTPLYFAAFQGHAQVVRLLLQHDDVDINKANKGGVVALHGASYNGHQDVVDMLLAAGANPNQRTETGHSPLFYAMVQNQDGVAQQLANPGVRTPASATPRRRSRPSPSLPAGSPRTRTSGTKGARSDLPREHAKSQSQARPSGVEEFVKKGSSRRSSRAGSSTRSEPVPPSPSGEEQQERGAGGQAGGGGAPASEGASTPGPERAPEEHGWQHSDDARKTSEGTSGVFITQAADGGMTMEDSTSRSHGTDARESDGRLTARSDPAPPPRGPVRSTPTKVQKAQGAQPTPPSRRAHPTSAPTSRRASRPITAATTPSRAQTAPGPISPEAAETTVRSPILLPNIEQDAVKLDALCQSLKDLARERAAQNQRFQAQHANEEQVASTRAEEQAARDRMVAERLRERIRQEEIKKEEERIVLNRARDELRASLRDAEAKAAAEKREEELKERKRLDIARKQGEQKREQLRLELLRRNQLAYQAMMDEARADVLTHDASFAQTRSHRERQVQLQREAAAEKQQKIQHHKAHRDRMRRQKTAVYEQNEARRDQQIQEHKKNVKETAAKKRDVHVRRQQVVRERLTRIESQRVRRAKEVQQDKERKIAENKRAIEEERTELLQKMATSTDFRVSTAKKTREEMAEDHRKRTANIVPEYQERVEKQGSKKAERAQLMRQYKADHDAFREKRRLLLGRIHNDREFDLGEMERAIDELNEESVSQLAMKRQLFHDFNSTVAQPTSDIASTVS